MQFGELLHTSEASSDINSRSNRSWRSFTLLFEFTLDCDEQIHAFAAFRAR
jgi:hypothetical protein